MVLVIEDGIFVGSAASDPWFPNLLLLLRKWVPSDF